VDAEVSFAKKLKKKIIPVFYRPCEVGLVYVNLNYIDVQGRKYIDNFNQILRALNAPAVGRVSNPTPSVQLGQSQAKSPTYEMPKPAHTAQSPIPNIPSANTLILSNGMEFMRVPAGKFLMGSKEDNKFAYNNEKCQHTVDIPYDYWMARYPVTNELYNEYVKAKGVKHPVDDWQKKRNHPVVWVSWKDMMAYYEWLNQILNPEIGYRNLHVRLPTEAEWEKAARGTDGREYPWGNTFDKNKCNTREGGKDGKTPVGLYSPQGDSPYGCADMSGNVGEWTHSLYKPYPYRVNDERENEETSAARVLRGGSFVDYERNTRCAYRDSYVDFPSTLRGFRVVVSPA
jgi:formylglycine-generating enzyme required for sulfatase activity